MDQSGAVSGADRDAALSQFLSMTEDRVDPDVAYSLLEAVGWDVQAATEQIFSTSPRSRPQSAVPMLPQETFPEVIPDDESSFLPDEVEELNSGIPAAAAYRRGDEGMGGSHQIAGGAGQEETDAQLAAAIEASYMEQTSQGREATDEEMMMRALQMSQAEEESRQRQSLRDQQEAELAESVLMDQQRDQEAKRRRAEEEEMLKATEQSRREEEQLQRVSDEKAAADLEEKRARIPEEPAPGETGRLQLMFRLPNGQRLQRAFRNSNVIGDLYDFVDIQHQELAGQRYRIVSNMPRKAYEDRQHTLTESGIQNQFVLMVEIIPGL